MLARRKCGDVHQHWDDRPRNSRGRDIPLRGDRLREEYSKMKERFALLEKLISEAVRNHK
jgi:hypothetical protein